MSYTELLKEFSEVGNFRLTLDSLLILQGPYLFIGVGENITLPLDLKNVGCKVLCNDLVVASKASLVKMPWLKADFKILDYKELSKEYLTLVMQQLCTRKSAHLVLESLNSGLWLDFKNIIIEFCDNDKHYDFCGGGREGQANNALACKKLLEQQGFNTNLVYGDNKQLCLMLYSSRNKLPLLQFPSKKVYERANGFMNDPGLKLTGNGMSPFDGNYYD